MELGREGNLSHFAGWKNDGSGSQVHQQWLQSGSRNSSHAIPYANWQVRNEFQTPICCFKRRPFPDRSTLKRIHHAHHTYIELEAGSVISEFTVATFCRVRADAEVSPSITAVPLGRLRRSTIFSSSRANHRRFLSP